MKRREFITLLGSVAVASPLAAQAQQPALPVIGYLSLRAAGDSDGNVAALRQGLGEAGFFVGQNVTIEIRHAEGHYDRLPVLVTELIQRPVSVLFTSSQDIARVAQAATTTTPVVFISGGDPAKLGLVDSLARPGGNLTGVNFVASELWAKQLGLLKELLPGVAVVGLLTNPKNVFTEPGISDAQSAAAVLGLKLIVAGASIEADLEPAIASLVRQGIEALFVPTDSFFNGRAGQLVSIAARQSLPAAYALREYAAAGGMMSYGASLLDAHRQVGIYIGRILKGTRPADLPVLQPTKFELVINLKAVKALGLTVPPTLLARADEVIE
jgi:putative tryptophan/tyrosine transport system substrate-binding protein